LKRYLAHFTVKLRLHVPVLSSSHSFCSENKAHLYNYIFILVINLVATHLRNSIMSKKDSKDWLTGVINSLIYSGKICKYPIKELWIEG
jgi:hypothetical protein